MDLAKSWPIATIATYALSANVSKPRRRLNLIGVYFKSTAFDRLSEQQHRQQHEPIESARKLREQATKVNEGYNFF